MKLFTITFLSGELTTVRADSYDVNPQTTVFVGGDEVVATFFCTALAAICETQPS